MDSSIRVKYKVRTLQILDEWLCSNNIACTKQVSFPPTRRQRDQAGKRA